MINLKTHSQNLVYDRLQANLTFPEDENMLVNEHKELMHEWVDQIWRSCSEDEASALCDLFVPDGFFPNYLTSKNRVLFIGRESRGLQGHNYITCLHGCVRKREIAGRSIARSRFWSTLLRVAWAAQNDWPKWGSIPQVGELCKNFAQPSEFSFAFINVSKFSNANKNSWITNEKLVQKSLDISKQDNLLMRQVELLAPDMVIGMNLSEWLKHAGMKEETNGKVAQLKSGEHRADYAWSFHFSAPKKSPERDLYPMIRRQFQPMPE